jgi:hypothetical protein
MKQSKLTIACAFVGVLFANSASAAVYHVEIIANPGFVGQIIGDITVTGTTVTAFTGTASGFGFGGIFDGPTTLGQSPGGPSFVGDNQWAGAPYYVTAGDGGSGGGWLLTNGSYNFRIYDYTDANNNYGDQLAWFGASGYNPATIDVTISMTEVTPLPAAWTMMLIGGVGLGVVTRRRKAKTALA